MDITEEEIIEILKTELCIDGTEKENRLITPLLLKDIAKSIINKIKENEK